VTWLFSHTNIMFGRILIMHIPERTYNLFMYFKIKLVIQSGEKYFTTFQL
jgi:hypothetical protein